MSEYEFGTFDAGTPSAEPAEEDVIGDIVALFIFAFTHILMKFSQCPWNFDEDVVGVDVLEFIDCTLFFFLCHNIVE